MAYNYGVCPPAQAALYVQTRARITALAVACECALSQPSQRPTHTGFLSDRFGRVVELLERDPGLTSGLVPFLQTWVFSWGGFFVESRRQEEYEWIAADIGQSVASIPRYLDLIEELLRIEPDFSADFRGGWRAVIPDPSHPWRVNTLKLLPEPLKGLGVRRRRAYWGSDIPDQIPDFYLDWEAWIDSYVERLASSEEAGAYDWQGIQAATPQHRQPYVRPR